MQSFAKLAQPWQILVPAVVLLLLLAVACGTAAPATPVVMEKEVVVEKEVIKEVVVEKVVVATPTAAPPPAQVEVHPGEVTWMIASWGTERFDPGFNPGNSGEYGRLLHAFLVSSDVKDGARVIIPGIATQWGLSADGLTWDFTIRKGVKWHDGTELTPEDVLWTLRHDMGPQAQDHVQNSTFVKLSQIMDRIEQTGPEQVSVITKTSVTQFIGEMSEASANWSGIMLPKRVELYDEAEALAYDKNPIGAGVLSLVEHVPADVMIFERFADYYHQPQNGFATDKRVNFTQLNMRLIPEEATRVAALRAGDADVAPVSLGARKQVEAGGGRLVFGQEGIAFSIRFLGCWKPEFPCSDKRVRQALNYAIDKEIVQNELYGGPKVMQIKGWERVSPSSDGYSTGLDPFPYDPDKARQLLAEAGYPDGKGFGKLIINTFQAASLPLMTEAAQLGAAFWKKELGLDVEVAVGEEAAVKKASKLTEDLYGQLLWRDTETELGSARSLTSQYGNPEKGDRGHNDPELFDLVEEALSVLEPVERERTIRSAWQRIREEAYYVGLGYINIPWGVGPRIQTWEPYPMAAYPSALHTITLK